MVVKSKKAPKAAPTFLQAKITDAGPGTAKKKVLFFFLNKMSEQNNRVRDEEIKMEDQKRLAVKHHTHQFPQHSTSFNQLMFY